MRERLRTSLPRPPDQESAGPATKHQNCAALRHAAACLEPPPIVPKIRGCGMLRHASTAGACPQRNCQGPAAQSSTLSRGLGTECSCRAMPLFAAPAEQMVVGLQQAMERSSHKAVGPAPTPCVMCALVCVPACTDVACCARVHVACVAQIIFKSSRASVPAQHVSMCVGGGGGVHHFYQVSRLDLYGHTGVLGSGRSPLMRPTVQARGMSLCCSSTSAKCT